MLPLIMSISGFTARRYALYMLSSIVMCPSPSFRHKQLFHQNDWTDWAGFSVDASFQLSYAALERN